MSGGEGSLVELTGSVVSGTKSSVTGEIGAGLFCQDQGRGKAVHSLFQGNALYGLEASGPGTTVSAVGCRLTGEVGASVSQGAELSLEASVVEENSGQGIIAYGEGLQEGSSRLTVKDSVIRQNCLEEEDVKYKDAPFEVVVMGLAEATLHGTLVQPTVSGLAVTLEGATLDVSASVVRGGSDLAVGAGRGLRVEQGAKCVVDGSLVEGMAESGVEVAHHLSHLAIEDAVVRRCNRSGTEGYGGILVSVGGVAELVGCSLMENRYAGANVISLGTDVSIDSSSISNNVPGLDGKVGMGLIVSNGAAAEVTETLLANNYGISVAVASDDSLLLLEDSVVTNTNPAPADGDGLVGSGLFVGAEASALLRRSLVSLSVQTGCLVDGSGAVLEAESALVRNTLNNAEEGAPLLPTSAGLWATAGANVELSNSSLADNWPFQMVVLGPESSVVAERTSVLQSQARELYEGEVPLERSVLVADGAHLSMSRCLLMHSAGWGLSAHEDGTSVDTDKCATTRYSQQEVNAFGMGAAVVQGASLLLTDSLFVGNASYAVGAFDGASADIQGCTLASTSPGGEWVEKEPGKVRLQAFGDGLTVVRATASVQDTLFTDNSRCGVYYYQSSGAIEGSLVTRSGAYGLAIYLPSPEVLFEQLSNFIFGNATALTGPTAAEVSKNADGMEVQSSPPKRF